MELAVLAIQLVALSLCLYQLWKLRNRREYLLLQYQSEQSRNLELMAVVLSQKSELAQAQEIQLAILTDLEKALESNQELRSQLASVLELESSAHPAMDLQLQSVYRTELVTGPVLVSRSEKALELESALVQQELPSLD